MNRLSLRLRFLLLLVLLLSVLFIAITLIIVRQDSKTLKLNLVKESKSFAALATQPIGNVFEIYQNSGSLKIQQQVNSLTDLNPAINQVEIVDTTNHRLFTQNPGSPINVSLAAVTSLDPNYIYNRSGDLVTVVQPYVENYGIHKYTVIYGVSYTSVNQSIRAIVLYISLLSIIILLASLILGYILINRFFLGPVVDISHLALKISQGDLNQSVQLGRNDEIGDLATAVDTMAGSLKDDIAKLQQLDTMKNEFMMITSHNLRTPLTVIEGYVELIKNSADNNLKKMLEPISVSIARLKGFSEDVITISAIEAGHNVFELQPLDMAPLLMSMAGEFAMQARQKDIDFQININTRCTVSLSKPHFRNALWNLLDNAYKFTPEKGKVTLNATDNGKQLQISVVDNGPGITASEVEKLFTKFHRGTSTLQYDYEGSGIGLYISKIIIEQHGGSITVDSTEGAGSTFTIVLPVIQN